MIENILSARRCHASVKFTVKSVLSVVFIALAVALPQLVHAFAGAGGGVKWLPMYAPVLLGACLLGLRWGLGIALLSPLMSFLITSLAGNPMPALARLPYVMAELLVFAAISGAFSRTIARRPLMAFVAVLAAQVGGRGLFLALAAISPLGFSVAWAQVCAGFLGLLLQAALIPVLVIALALLARRDER